MYIVIPLVEIFLPTGYRTAFYQIERFHFRDVLNFMLNTQVIRLMILF
ncbi:uncharacterized protein METZ01_LOCUS351837, partial [marine metagenome]